MKRSRGKELKQEMNLTNMIDIVFAILIVFIISAPLMSQGVKVDLPKAEAPTMEQEKLLKVSTYYGARKRIPKAMGPENIIYGDKVINVVQKLGVTKLGFLTMNPKEKPGKR